MDCNECGDRVEFTGTVGCRDYYACTGCGMEFSRYNGRATYSTSTVSMVDADYEGWEEAS